MAVDFTTLAAEVESQGAVGAGQARDLVAALRGLFPKATIDPSTLGSTDALLHLTDRVAPGSDIHLRGMAVEPNGHWSCVIRRSDARDNDEFVASGKGPTLSAAILIATLRLIGYKAANGQLG